VEDVFGAANIVDMVLAAAHIHHLSLLIPTLHQNSIQLTQIYIQPLLYTDHVRLNRRRKRNYHIPRYIDLDSLRVQRLCHVSDFHLLLAMTDRQRLP
jgi:hypothetical protein